MKLTGWRVGGVTLILLGIALAGGGGYLFNASLERSKKQAALRTSVEATCKKQLGQIGVVGEERGQLMLRVSPVSDPRAALADATLALAFCPTRTLAQFCIGIGCSGQADGPVSMILRLTAPINR